ncbi:hypothetical protein [Hydrogenophaga sp. OTU3427]|uniref:hypothetical protein n=1 Tax=Hydrogenophaga sp. OTU3427 TaxID=3043856 RepID=UPI00313E4216
MSGRSLDFADHEWVYSRQRGYPMQLLLSPTKDAPSLHGVGGIALKVCLSHQTRSTVESVFWFRLDDDRQALCWRTLPTLIEAMDVVVSGEAVEIGVG